MKLQNALKNYKVDKVWDTNNQRFLDEKEINENLQKEGKLKIAVDTSGAAIQVFLRFDIEKEVEYYKG